MAIHSFTYSRGLVSDGLFDARPRRPGAARAARPSCGRTRANGRKAFYVASHACEIVGMPTDEARALSAR